MLSLQSVIHHCEERQFLLSARLLGRRMSGLVCGGEGEGAIVCQGWRYQFLTQGEDPLVLCYVPVV